MNELLTGGGDIQAIIVGALVVFSVFLGALGIRSSNSRRGAIASYVDWNRASFYTPGEPCSMAA